jgi:hypothetical protein
MGHCHIVILSWKNVYSKFGRNLMYIRGDNRVIVLFTLRIAELPRNNDFAKITHIIILNGTLLYCITTL